MTKKTTLTLFYGGIALISVAIIFLSRYLHHQNQGNNQMPKPATGVINPGKTETQYWFPIEEDPSRGDFKLGAFLICEYDVASFLFTQF